MFGDKKEAKAEGGSKAARRKLTPQDKFTKIDKSIAHHERAIQKLRQRKSAMVREAEIKAAELRAAVGLPPVPPPPVEELEPVGS